MTLTRTGLSLNLSGPRQLRVLVRVDYRQGLNVYVSSYPMVANLGIIYIRSERPSAG